MAAGASVGAHQALNRELIEILRRDALVDASVDKLIRDVESCLRRGASPNSIDRVESSRTRGWSALHMAVKSGIPRVVQTLIKARADIDAGYPGETPLAIAIENAHKYNYERGYDSLGVVEILLAAEAKIRGRDFSLIREKYDLRPRIYCHLKLLLEAAVEKEKLKVAKLYEAMMGEKEVDFRRLLTEGRGVSPTSQIKAGSEPATTILNFAIKRKETPLWVLEELCRHATKPEIDVWTDVGDGEIMPPLVQALVSRNAKAVSALISVGVDLNNYFRAVIAGEELSVTPVYYAACYSRYWGSDDILNSLLSAGANVSLLIGPYNETVLGCLIRRGNPQIDIQNLLSRTRIDVNAVSCAGMTPLYQAIKYYKHEKALGLVTTLLAYGADPNSANLHEEYLRPLSEAAKNGKLEIVQALLGARANLDHKDKDGSTALDHALDNGHYEVVVELLHAGVKDDSRADSPAHKDKRSPGSKYVEVRNKMLKAAAMRGDVTEIKALIAKDANLKAVEAMLVDQPAARKILQEQELLRLAAEAESAENMLRITELFAEGISPNVVDGEGHSALHVAARVGSLSVVGLLLNARVKYTVTPGGRTPLETAQENNQTQIVTVLTQLNTVVLLLPTTAPGEKAFAELSALAIEFLSKAVKSNDLAQVVTVLTRIKTVSSLLITTTPGKKAFEELLVVATELLYKAARSNNLAQVKALLAAGVGPDACPKRGGTPLHAAVTRGHVDIVECLLQGRANPWITDARGKTCIEIARENNDGSEIQEQLVSVLFREPRKIRVQEGVGAGAAAFGSGIELASIAATTWRWRPGSGGRMLTAAATPGAISAGVVSVRSCEESGARDATAILATVRAASEPARVNRGVVVAGSEISDGHL